MSQYVNGQNIHELNWEAIKRGNLSVGFEFQICARYCSAL